MVAASGTGEPLVCPVTATNTGNVRLSGVSINQGTCTVPAALVDINQTITCTVDITSTQDDFEAGNMTLAATVFAMSNSANPTPVTAADSATLVLPITRQLLLTRVRTDNTTVVDKVGTVVHMTVTASNGGNTHLKAVNIDMPGLQLLSCTNATGPVHLPTDLLVGAGTIQCSGTFSFDQDALEAGSRNFSAAGSGSNLGDAGAASNVVEVVVAASPQLQVDVDALNCTRPPRMRELQSCALAACLV
jgi:hypothetical protein